MTFINEYIPAEDLKKYGFAVLNKRPSKGLDASRDWTIDREANIWLRKFYTESDHTESDGGYTGVSAWDFYWKGNLMMVEVKSAGIGGGDGKPLWQRKKLLSINIPSRLENERSQILKDLEKAFTAYRGAGVFGIPEGQHYSFTLEV